MRNLERMEKVNLDLCRVVFVGATRFEQASGFHVSVASGFRTEEEQFALYVKGASKTTRSKHMVGEALDLAIVNGPEFIKDGKFYASLNGFIQKAAQEQGISVLWGGWWKMRDYMHWALSTPEEVELARPATTPAKDGGARKPALRLLDKPSA